MSKVPDNILNPKLWVKVREEIRQEYPKHSAYRSMLMVKTYKKRGGKFSGPNQGLDKWLDEEWINVYEYLKTGKKVKCGDKSMVKHSACRPYKRIDSSTPTTITELLKKFSKQEILTAVEKKNKDPSNLILRWNTLTVYKKN